MSLLSPEAPAHGPAAVQSQPKRMAMTPRAKMIWTLVLLVLALLAMSLPRFNMPVLAMDEGILLVYPELILKGLLPYRDFETFYAPGNILALSAVYALFKPALMIERTVGLAYCFVLFGSVFALVRRWSLPLAVICTLLTALLVNLLHLIAFAWWGGVACLFSSFLVLAGPQSRRRALVGGFLAGAAMLYRQDLGPTVILSSLPLWLMLDRRHRFLHLGGLAVSMLPLAWLTLAAGPAQVFNNLFLLPVIQSSPGRRLPFSSAPDYVQALFWFYLAAMVCNLVAAIIEMKKEPRSFRARLFLCFALFGLGVSHEAMQRLDIVHAVFAGFSSVALLPLSLVIFTRQTRLGVETAYGQCAAGCAVLLGFGAATWTPDKTMLGIVRSGWVITSLPVKAADREVPLGDIGSILAVQKLADALASHSKPGETLFVGPGDLRFTRYNDIYLYHLLSWLKPASYYLEMNPFSANGPGSSLAADLRKADWVVLNSFWDRWDEPNESRRPGSNEPNEVVRDHFVRRVKAGGFTVYERKDRTAK